MRGKCILSVAKSAELRYTYLIDERYLRNEEPTVKTHDFWYESDLSGFLVVENYS